MQDGEQRPSPTVKNAPSVLLVPQLVDKDNMMATVIKDGFQKMEEVYKNVPKEHWPK